MLTPPKQKKILLVLQVYNYFFYTLAWFHCWGMWGGAGIRYRWTTMSRSKTKCKSLDFAFLDWRLGSGKIEVAIETYFLMRNLLYQYFEVLGLLWRRKKSWSDEEYIFPCLFVRWTLITPLRILARGNQIIVKILECFTVQ